MTRKKIAQKTTHRIPKRSKVELKRKGGNPWIIGFIALVLIAIIWMAFTSENVDSASIGKAIEPNVRHNERIIPEGDVVLTCEIAQGKILQVIDLVENSNIGFNGKLAAIEELQDVQVLLEKSCQTEK
ncbi:hypothetical protein COV12_03005 [Candidatus Woesearchaeota archaeon CG10_big_fil_rev_8_21_14_0_10_32_24]|nr:MAG: hypothetical protein COV12_03005 [Candidatus Woesearchaeota archaeon CG10_big_fil_rev_8_21_14_0_10_32_24]